MDISVTYDREWGVGWIAAEPAHLQRASHALAHDGGVWLIDPVNGDGLEERLARLGEVRGVLQLIDRHPRDCAALARRNDAGACAGAPAPGPGAANIPSPWRS